MFSIRCIFVAENTRIQERFQILCVEMFCICILLLMPGYWEKRVDSSFAANNHLCRSTQDVNTVITDPKADKILA